MNAGAISDRLLTFCVALVGRFKGGLGHVNVVSSLIFSGMSGSAVADAAGIGKVIIEMMTKDGRYSRGYAAAITAASATIGPIIPPSIPMVLYALVSDTSIGYLFLGGILPGLLMGVVLMAMNSYISHKRGFARRRGGAAARDSGADRARLSGPADAGDPAVRHLWRRHDADRGGRGRRGLCAGAGGVLLPLAVAQDAARHHARQRQVVGVGGPGDRRRADPELHRRLGEHPQAAGRRDAGHGDLADGLHARRQRAAAAAGLHPGRHHHHPGHHAAVRGRRPRRWASTWCISASSSSSTA